MKACFALSMALALVLAGGAPGEEPAGAATELSSLKQLYGVELDKLGERLEQGLREALEQQVQSLRDLEVQYQMSGRLKPLIAVRNERMRFMENPDINAIEVVEAPEPLAALQTQYIERYKELHLAHARGVQDLSRKYGRRLQAIQVDLTKQGKINEALQVLSEIERVRDSKPLADARRQIEAGGTVPVTAGGGGSEPPAPAPVQTERLARMIRGEILSWNSVTYELTCRYDFSDREQMQDWMGGTWDELRARLVCENTEASLKPVFETVKRIDYDMFYYAGDGPLRVKLGSLLVADLQPGDNGKALLHQGNDHFSLLSSLGGAETFRRYSCSLTIDAREVHWRMDVKTLGPAALPAPLAGPLHLTLGHNEAHAMFDNIVISGKLSAEFVKTLP